MLDINHLGIRPSWLIPTHQHSKPLLISQYMTLFYFDSNMINNELKG